ncbi:ribosomal RNA processing protein 1 homolog B-like [Phycodurus eques]|uniref:ribosomal RNA processing protein 1 homolog B-like n=1 Tax=Phycodurus eques TaxID=693459 RepID=UPI002ACDCFE2|nr:ribosomal RNA processing protein 1 homolog B-like [Phycodurus eques]
MAALQEPEIRLAQKLASNEQPIRTKALKRLTKYINVRSQKTTDGFTSEELLKLWKGLFYCLWMQDKPLLQEDLSDSISALMHSFHDINGQLLYLDSCLKTFKREWTGIDRLRMDKFFQLVRFMFRKSFEMLKRKNWESSAVARFLEVFATQLLNSGNDAPAGLQFHILDLYLTELGAVGASELTADQNLIFVQPFCKTAAKTKDWTLFRAIYSSIFSAIIDQAPDAIEDLMKELKAAESFEGDEKNLVRQINGSKSYLDDHDLKSGDNTSVLQFNYAALADELFEMSSRRSTPSHNRRKLYKIIKVFRNLSKGIFPHVRCPKEVSTDEDDEIFGSRKRMKDGRFKEQAAKNRKKKLKLKHRGDPGKDDVKPTDLIVKDIKKPKKTKKRARRGECLSGDLNASTSYVEHTEVPNQSKILLNGSADKAGTSVSVSDKASKRNSCITNNAKSKKKKKRAPSQLKQEVSKNNTAQEVDTTAVMADYEGTSKLTKFESQVDRREASALCEITLNEPELQTLNNAKTKAQKVKASVTWSQQKMLDSPSVSCHTSDDVGTSPGLKNATALTNKSKRKKNKGDKVTIPSQSASNESESASDLPMETPQKKKNKRSSVQVKKVGSIEKEPKVFSSSEKLKKKKRKIPVEFEFEAVELESATPTNNSTPSAAGGKIKEMYGSSIPKAKPKLMKTLSCDLVTFQTNAKVPTPLFFRAAGSCKTTLFGNEMGQTPMSDSKKVTFHLKNNKTAEFMKNDRSLLLSPEGSSKVPFDPKQKPKSGVLKSSPIPLSTNIKKTPKASRKRVLSTPKSTPKRRPSAADFF